MGDQVRHLKLVVLALAFASLCISGCSKQEGWQAKDVYDKVLQMYEKSEIKATMDYKSFYEDKKSATTEFWFGKLYSKDEQHYYMVIEKNQGDGREAKEKTEESLKSWESFLKKNGHEVFRKGNIVIRVPKTTNPKLDKNVYDLFMSYVK